MEDYLSYMMEQLQRLLAIDSPTGMTGAMTGYVMEEYRRLGYDPVKTRKGGVTVYLGGEGAGTMMLAHGDTLGAMVAEVKADGRLRVVPLGGLNANNVETENCRVYAHDGRVVEGTIQLINASTHVNLAYQDTARTFTTVEVVLDCDALSKEAVHALGIDNGCFVCLDPRTRIGSSGYIKSRFLDDKLCVAILLAYAKYLKEEQITPRRALYQYVTVFEEVGHGAASGIPAEVEEVISVDMGCVGQGLACTERQVSICAKDLRGPYHYDVVQGLVSAAQAAGIDYAVDVFYSYSSDADMAMAAGVEARHGQIGPGVYASHGYERAHIDGVRNTFELLKAYLG